MTVPFSRIVYIHGENYKYNFKVAYLVEISSYNRINVFAKMCLENSSNVMCNHRTTSPWCNSRKVKEKILSGNYYSTKVIWIELLYCCLKSVLVPNDIFTNLQYLCLKFVLKDDKVEKLATRKIYTTWIPAEINWLKWFQETLTMAN